MRASSLSNKEVTELLSRYFVPVLSARDDSRNVQPSKEDQVELLRIARECQKNKLEAGSVCVYILRPDGSVAATQLVQKACKPDQLIPLLKSIVAKEKIKPSQSKARAAARRPMDRKSTGGALLHIWTRFEGNRADYGTSEDWVELTAADCAALAPPADAKDGAAWTIPPSVVEKLARFFYPPGPNWDHRLGKVLKAELSATLAASTERHQELTLRGKAERTHPFAGAGTDGTVSTKLAGFARWDRQKKVFTALAIVSEDATYVWQWQGKPQVERMAIAVELEPGENR